MKRNRGVYRYGLGRSLLNYGKDVKRYKYDVSLDFVIRMTKVVQAKKPFKFLD